MQTWIIRLSLLYLALIKTYKNTEWAYFCHHLSDNYVDLADTYVDLSVIYVNLSYQKINHN